MSPRRNRRVPRPGPVDPGQQRRSVETVEDGPDGQWHVRHVPGSAATKMYRCPGCDQEIRVGVAHVVAWPVDGPVDERRHWHTGCWRARGRRGPVVRRR